MAPFLWLKQSIESSAFPKLEIDGVEWPVVFHTAVDASSGNIALITRWDAPCATRQFLYSMVLTMGEQLAMEADRWRRWRTEMDYLRQVAGRVESIMRSQGDQRAIADGEYNAQPLKS